MATLLICMCFAQQNNMTKCDQDLQKTTKYFKFIYKKYDIT